MKKILIVDDSKTMTKVLSCMLLDYFPQDSIEIIKAEDGADALFALKENDIDLLFLDMMMPVVDGHGVAQYINSRELDVKTVIISSTLDKDVVTSLAKLGFKNFLPKPIHISTLEGILEKIGF